MLRPMSPSAVLIFLLLPGWRLCEAETYSSLEWKFPTYEDSTKGNTSLGWEFQSDDNTTVGSNSLQPEFPTNDNSTTAKNDYKTRKTGLQWKFSAGGDFGVLPTVMTNLAQVEMPLFEQHIDNMRVLLNNVRNKTAVAADILDPYMYLRYGTKMYKLLEGVTYEEAKAACEAIGATLLTPKDGTTLDRVTTTLAVWLFLPAWLGLRRNPAADGQQWVWSDGEPLGEWEQWGSELDCGLEPPIQYVTAISLVQEYDYEWLRPQVQPPMCAEKHLHCAYLDDSGDWTKASCDSKANGICERPVPGCSSVRPREVFRVHRDSGIPVFSTWKNVGSENWAQWNVQEVIVELFTNFRTVLKLVFDGRDSDHMSWFSLGNLLSAPWTDLSIDRPFFFSIEGGNKDDRRFFIHESYRACEYDQGWLAVLGSENPPCAWERPDGVTNDDLPIILYSKSSGRVNWEQNPNDVGIADFLAVSIVEC